MECVCIHLHVCGLCICVCMCECVCMHVGTVRMLDLSLNYDKLNIQGVYQNTVKMLKILNKYGIIKISFQRKTGKEKEEEVGAANSML